MEKGWALMGEKWIKIKSENIKENIQYMYMRMSRALRCFNYFRSKQQNLRKWGASLGTPTDFFGAFPLHHVPE